MLTHTRHIKYKGSAIDTTQELGYFQLNNPLYDPYATLIPAGTPWWLWCDEDGSNLITVDETWGRNWVEENNRRYQAADTLAREFDQREQFFANGGVVPEQKEMTVAQSMQLFNSQLAAAEATISQEVTSELRQEAATKKANRDPIQKTMEYAVKHPFLSGLVASFLHSKVK